MKEVKDERMLADFMIRTSGDRTRENVDLSQLADQLLAIAGQLRSDDAPATGNASDKARSSNVSSFRRQPPAAAINSQSSTSGSTNLDSAKATRFSDDKSALPDLETRRAAYAETARWIYDTRRRRTTIFENAELFGEPAWDILLDLYIAHTEGKPVSVSSACIGSAAPPTTGLRWLGLLAENGLVLREHDAEDQRRVLVRLTEGGLKAMDNYFANGGFPV